MFPRQTLVNIQVKQNTFPFYEKKCLKNHRISNTREGQSPKGPKSCFQNLGWVNHVQAEFFYGGACETFFLKGISRSNKPWTESEVIPHDLNTLTDYRGHSNGQGGKWNSDILDLVSGLAAGFPAYTGANHFYLSCVVVSWLKKINHILQVRSNTGGRTYLSFLSPPKSKDRAKYMLRP